MPHPSLVLTVRTRGKGTYEITGAVREAVTRSGVRQGIATVFIRHTSASLLITENADPSARADLEAWFERHVPPEKWFTHTLEGPDDMTSHIKAAITRSSEVIPVVDGEPVLGTWQGIFVFEHRDAAHTREVVVTVTGA
jgi:secondary thiamine-phosphate synthase enzyme